MKTSHARIIVEWHQSIHNLRKVLHPHLFRQPRPVVRRTHPLSSSEHVSRDSVPRSVPCFNPTFQVLPNESASDIRAYLFALSTSYDNEYTAITSDDEFVVLDSACSIAITNNFNDFDTTTFQVQDHTISGIASGLAAKGIGTAIWQFTDTEGNQAKIPIQCLYVPDSPCRLLPPQQLSMHKDADSSNGAWVGNGKAAHCFWNGQCILFKYDRNNNLPIAKLSCGTRQFDAFCASSSSDVTNLTTAQRKLLRLHHRFGHRAFQDIQTWAREGVHGVPTVVANCQIPVCQACQFGTSKKRPHTKDNSSPIAEPTKPGEFVSVDMMEAGTPGLIPFTNGCPSKRRYLHCTMWVDAFSKYIHSHLQEEKTTKATLVSKDSFETFSKRFDVSIRHVHSDNGVFRSKAFTQHCDLLSQSFSYCGVGAHWQNGSIERYIGVITTKARTMLLHALKLWSGVITPEFWSFAVSQAVRIHNATPRRDKKHSPFSEFTGEENVIGPADFRVFGCPVYVLEKALQDGNRPSSKWSDRCHLGVYVGHSPYHASNVILVYNPKTKLVSPQYHVILDESFDTVGVACNRPISRIQVGSLDRPSFQSPDLGEQDGVPGHSPPGP